MPESIEDRLKRYAKEDAERGIKSSAPTSTTTTESTSPTAGTTPASTNVWDSQIAPLIKNNKWEANFDSTKTLYLPALKKVLNGEYDKFAKYGEAKTTFDAFKKSAEDYKNMLFDIDKGVKIPNDKFQKINGDWQNNFYDFAQAVADPTDDNPGINPLTFNLMSHKDYIKNTTAPYIDSNKSKISTNVKYDKGIIGDIFGGDKLIADPGYTRLVEWEADYKNEINKNVSAVLDSWSNLSLFNVNKIDNTAYKNDVYNFVNESLKFITKSGANTNDETVNSIYKSSADNILKLMKGKSIDDAIEIIKQNKTDLNPLLTNTGYINKVFVFNKFSNEGLGKNNLYYENDSSLYDKVNLATSALENQEYYKSEVKEYKTEVKKQAANLYTNSSFADIKDQLFNLVINEYGDVNSLDEFKKQINKFPPDFAKALAVRNSSAFNPFPQMGYRIEPQLDDIYEDIKDNYTQAYDKVKPNQTLEKYKNTLYTLGLGDVVAPNIYFKGVDLTLNEFGNIANKDANIKQQNISNLFKIISNDNVVNNSDIVLLDQTQINKGLNAYDIDDFQSDKENNREKFNEFFNNNKNLDFSKMSFQRFSNVPGHAYYEFETPGDAKANLSEKRLGVLIPYTKLENLDGKGTGEDLYVKTKESGADRAFHFTGKYTMPDTVDEETGKPLVKNKSINLDPKTESKYITYDYLLDDGTYATNKIDLGHTSGTPIETSRSILNKSVQLLINDDTK